MTRNKLTDAMAAVDSGESPFVGDGSADFNVEAASDVPIEPSVAPKVHDGWNRTVFQAPQSFGAIPATDHDALEAQLTSELADGVEKLLSTREATHGDYANTARVAQILKRILTGEMGDEKYTDRQRESLDLICTKLARIVSGNANEPDHWLDIAGYAKIAIDE